MHCLFVVLYLLPRHLLWSTAVFDLNCIALSCYRVSTLFSFQESRLFCGQRKALVSTTCKDDDDDDDGNRLGCAPKTPPIDNDKLLLGQSRCWYATHSSARVQAIVQLGTLSTRAIDDNSLEVSHVTSSASLHQTCR